MAEGRFQYSQGAKKTIKEKQEAAELGRLGEQMAAKYLEDKGYTIIERNYRKGHLEIDLIAMDGDELVIVEVKTRSDNVVMLPEEAVNHKKRVALLRLANQYVLSHHRNENVRFDIVAITLKPGEEPVINHLCHAFDAVSY